MFVSSSPVILSSTSFMTRQEQVFRDILSCFIKPEHLIGKTAGHLKLIDSESDEERLLSSRSVFLVKKTKDIVEGSHRNDLVVVDFLEKKVTTAYLLCAKHMQKRLPLDNKLLRCVFALDPAARGHSATAKALKELSDCLKYFLAEDLQEKIDLEIHRFQVDSHINTVEGQRIDAWWASVISTNKYPALSRMAKVCLRCFHGPRVESSFNLMGDIVDIRSTRMNITAMSAVQTVKYGLKSRNSTAIQLFKKVDIKHDQVDGNLCRNF